MTAAPDDRARRLTQAALKAWATRRAAGWQHPRRKKRQECHLNGIVMPDAGRLTDYTKLADAALFHLLRAEQLILERHANHPARAGWIRGEEGSGVGFYNVVSGGSFAGGRATMMAGHAVRRLHRIEVELERRSFDADTITSHRFGDDEAAERVGILTDQGNTDFDYSLEDVA